MADKHDVLRMRMQSEADRTSAALAEIARTLANYRSELTKNGFTRNEALQLVIEYQDSIFRYAKPRKDGD